MVDLGVRIEEVIKAMFEKSSSIIKGKREELANQSSPGGCICCSSKRSHMVVPKLQLSKNPLH